MMIATVLVTAMSQVLSILPVSAAPTNITLNVGEVYTLNSQVVFEDMTKSSVSSVDWKSDNSNVATVNASGQITGKSRGTTIIRAKIKNSNSEEVDIRVSVKPMVTGITLSSSHMSLHTGENKSIVANITPNYALNKSIIWASSNNKVATISGGMVKGIAPGTAEITAKTSDGGYVAKCSINVDSMVTGINNKEPYLDLNVGDSHALKVNVLPEYAFEKSIIYSIVKNNDDKKTSENDIVRISSTGVITAVKEGKATVNLKTKDGDYQSTVTVNVHSEAQGLIIADSKGSSINETEIEAGGTRKLSGLVKVGNGYSNKYPITWTSDDKKVAIVDNSGNVKAVSKGKTNITATLVSNGRSYYAHCTVYVTSNGTISLSDTSIDLHVGEQKVITASILPYNLNQSSIRWKSLNPKIASVSGGTIKGLSSGTTTIQATSADGSHYANCSVRISSTVSGLCLNETDASIPLGKTIVIEPTVTPSSAYQKGVEHSLKGNTVSVKKVDNKFYVTGIKQGSSSITFKTIDGGYTKTTNITVTDRDQKLLVYDANGSLINSASETPITSNKQINTCRLFGTDRYKTSMSVCDEFIKQNGKINSIIISNGNNFPDALSSSLLSKEKNAPILLVDNHVNESNEQLSYIYKNLSTDGTIYVLGGEGVIRDDFITDLKNKGYLNIVRLGGNDRFETNVAIANSLSLKTETPIILVNSNDFPDALSISSISAVYNYPIFLTNANSMPEIVSNKIKELRPSKVYLIGGNGSLNESLVTELQKNNSISKNNISRISGKDRYETSINICKNFKLNANSIIVSSGENFPDSLSASALAANIGAYIVLTNGTDFEKQYKFISSRDYNKVYIIGGTGSVTEDIENSFK